MAEQSFQPISRFSNVGPGSTFRHRSATITVTDDGIEVRVNGQFNRDPRRVDFSPPGGVCATYNCFAVRQGKELLLFEGSGLGMYMLTREQVESAIAAGI